MIDSTEKDSSLDPKLREKLLQESKNPFRGIRQLVWIACLGSGCIGLLIMGSKILSGEGVSSSDVLIQFAAILCFGGLIFWDRSK